MPQKDIVIVVVDLPLDQVSNEYGRVMNIDQLCDSDHKALLYLSSKYTNSCSGLDSIIKGLWGEVLLEHTRVDILARYTWSSSIQWRIRLPHGFWELVVTSAFIINLPVSNTSGNTCSIMIEAQREGNDAVIRTHMIWLCCVSFLWMDPHFPLSFTHFSHMSHYDSLYLLSHMSHYDSFPWVTMTLTYVSHLTHPDSLWVILCDLLSRWHYCPCDGYCSCDSIVLFYYKYWQSLAL